jgi:hypothetical protein
MHFAYQGFTNERDRRFFTFRGSEAQPAGVYSISIDLPLLSRHRVPVQEGPMFCLALLTAALLDGPGSLERFRNYSVVEEDFAGLLKERAKQAAEKAMRKTARKPPFRRPPSTSNIHLGPAALVPHTQGQ